MRSIPLRPRLILAFGSVILLGVLALAMTDKDLDRWLPGIVYARQIIGIAASIGGILVGIGIGALWADRTLFQSLRRLQSLANEIGKGGDPPVASPTSGIPEIDRTVQAFGDMSDRLRGREAVARSSEARYRLLAENLSDIVVTADADNITRYVSPAVKDVLGYDPAEILGGNSGWMVHPDDMATTVENLGRLITGPSKAVTRHRFRHKNGHYVWLETASQSVFDPGTGDLTEIISVSRDITESKSAEAALMASEERYRLLAENSNDLIILQDADARALYVSPSSTSLLGYEPPDIAAMTAETLLHPEDVASFIRTRREVVYDGIPRTSVHRLRRHDGSYIWVEASLRQIVGSEGNPGRTLLVVHDINERKIAEDEAATLHGLLVDAIDSMPDFVMRFDRHRRLLLTNASVRREDRMGLFQPGRTFESLVRELRTIQMAGQDPEALEQLIQAEIARHLAADGTPFDVVLYPGHWAVQRQFRTKDGGVLVIVTDITAQKRAAEALEEARRAAEAANEAKSAFLASMSHEIRTPMNAIIGFSDLLLDSELDANQRAQLGILRDASRSLLVIINDILDLSKIEAGKLDLERVPLDPTEIVQSAIAMVQSQAEAKGLALRLDLDPAIPPWIAGDPTRLRQILLNLLGNAVKFTERGQITVTAGMESEVLLRFAIQDSGIGIPEDRQHLLFRDFSQIDHSTTRRFGGTGLGLSICKRLAAAMGGEIGVVSRQGEGSNFWFTVAVARATAPMPRQRIPELVPGRRARILVAEDVQINQILITAMLKAAGHDAVIVEDGARAVAAMQESAFDLVLMDMEMPVMDGLEATEAIRALGGAAGLVPIVALTANAMAEAIDRCRSAGMNDHLSKPIDRAELNRTIAKWSVGSA